MNLNFNEIHFPTPPLVISQLFLRKHLSLGEGETPVDRSYLGKQEMGFSLELDGCMIFG